MDLKTRYEIDMLRAEIIARGDVQKVGFRDAVQKIARNLVLMGDRLLGLLSGEYVEAFGLLRIVALSSFFVAAYSFFVPIQNVRMRVEGGVVGVRVTYSTFQLFQRIIISLQEV